MLMTKEHLSETSYVQHLLTWIVLAERSFLRRIGSRAQCFSGRCHEATSGPSGCMHTQWSVRGVFGSFSGRDHLGLGVLFLMILANLPRSSPLIVSCTLSTLLFFIFLQGLVLFRWFPPPRLSTRDYAACPGTNVLRLIPLPTTLNNLSLVKV